MDDNQLSDRAYEDRVKSDLGNVIADTLFVAGGFAILASIIIIVWAWLP